MSDVRAVMDAAGSEQAAVFGYFEGGPMSILFAATYPERTRSLVLFGTSGSPPSALRSDEGRAAALEDVISHWGDGTLVLRFAPDADDVMKAWWGARERLAGSPGAIRHLFASSAATDVREVLPVIQTPTLVVQRTDDVVLDPSEGRYLAEHIPGAKLVELAGSSTLPWVEADSLLDEIEEFLTGVRPSRVADRVLATILFTDLVGSTETARSMGDCCLVTARRAASRRCPSRARPPRRRGDRHRRRRLLRCLRRARPRDPLRARHRGRDDRARVARPSRPAHGRGRTASRWQAAWHRCQRRCSGIRPGGSRARCS